MIAIEDQGGDPGIRDRALLESAVATPQQQFGGEYFHADIPAIAAAYAFHICMNHPFVDGNKRAATAAMIAFLSDNGWTFDATADVAEPIILQLAAGSIDKPAFTDWARTQMHEKPKMELREFFAQLNYAAVAEFFESGLVHDNPDLAHKERFDTMMEAARTIPAIHEANLGALQAEQAGHDESAKILRAQSLLLTALYRIAQDMGYEW
jgi:death-on-curing protein